MRYIRKSPPPQELITWVKGHKAGEVPKYDGPEFPKLAIRLSLLAEQGFICAYTMIAMMPSTAERSGEVCHIEHLVPQSDSKVRDKLEETVVYRNMLACFPGTAGEQNPGFGATKKDDNILPLTPLVQSCEKRLTFKLDGTVKPTTATDDEAKKTISILGLNCKLLQQSRLASFHSHGLGLESDMALSLAEAKRLAVTARKLRANGSYIGYCLAVASAAEEFADWLKKESKKNKYRQAAKKRGRK